MATGIEIQSNTLEDSSFWLAPVIKIIVVALAVFTILEAGEFAIESTMGDGQQIDMDGLKFVAPFAAAALFLFTLRNPQEK